MLRILLALFVLMLTLFAASGLSGCSGKKPRSFDEGKSLSFSDADQKAIEKEIRHLARGKQVSDIEGMAIYSEAVVALTNRGSRIEPQLLEAIAGNDDWSVRRGVIEVLGSVGTRRCVDHLIAATGDAVPLVGLYAHKTLQAMTGFYPIPAAGEATGANGLPPVPQRSPTNLELDADEKLWASWHEQYGRLLQKMWTTWWKENRGTVDLK